MELIEACRSFDLALLELMNGKERDLDNWASLFREADPRFTFTGVKRPSGSKLSFIEARWQGDEAS